MHYVRPRPVGMVEILEYRLLLLLSSSRATGSQSLALISSGQQSGDKAIKLFEQHRFLVEGEQLLVKLLGAARQIG